MDQLSGDMGKFLQKHQSAAAWILILFGICILWSSFHKSFVHSFVPTNMVDYVYNICNSLPQIIIAAGIIAARYLSSYSAEKETETRKPKQKKSITGNPIVHISS